MDGRARILRPVRDPNEQMRQSPIPHSSSMPILRAATSTPQQTHAVNDQMRHLQQQQQQQQQHQQQQQQQMRTRTPQPTTPSTSRNGTTKQGPVISELVFAEKIRYLLVKMRTLVIEIGKEVMSENHEDNGEKAYEMCDKLEKLYNEIEKWSKIPIRRDTNLAALLNSYAGVDNYIMEKIGSTGKSYNKFQSLFECADLRASVERNVVKIAEMTRKMEFYRGRRPSLFAPPPPLLEKDASRDGNQKFRVALDALKEKIANGNLLWRFENVKHPKYDGICLLYQVVYTLKKSGSFTAAMKSVLLIKNSKLVDIVMGNIHEDLYDDDGIKSSSYSFYRNTSRCAKSQLLETSLSNFTVPSNFALCNNYIQYYVNCMSTPCSVCKKILYQFSPPVLVTRDNPPSVYHEYCYRLGPTA